MSKLERRKSCSPSVFKVKFPYTSLEDTPITVIKIFLQEQLQKELPKQPISKLKNSNSHQSLLESQEFTQLLNEKPFSKEHRSSHHSSLQKLMQPTKLYPRASSFDYLQNREPIKFYRKTKESHRKRKEGRSKYSMYTGNNELRQIPDSKDSVFTNFYTNSSYFESNSLNKACNNVNTQLLGYRRRLNKLRDHYQNELKRRINHSSFSKNIS
jgi:hypothetical protein